MPVVAVDESIQLLWPEAGEEKIGDVDTETALLAERRAKAFRLYTRGLTLKQVSEEMVEGGKGPSIATVSRDVNHVLAGYRRMAAQDAALHLARELGRLNTLEAEAWEAWERSKGELVETFTGKTDRGSSARVVKRQRIGDARFMKIILDIHAQRCEMLGLTGKSVLDVGDRAPKYVLYVEEEIGEAV